MNQLQTYAALRASGIDLIAQCHALTHTAAPAPGEQLTEKLTALGMPEADAHTLAELTSVYYTPTSFTRRQRQAIAGAKRNRHSLATLEMIERYAWQAPTKAQAWRLREELCSQAGETSAIERLAASYLKEWKRKKKRPAPERGVRRYQHGELATLALTGNSSAIADMYNSLMQLRSDDPFGAAEEIFFGGSAAARATLSTTVVIPIADLAALTNGDGDDIQLQLTNGAIISGAEYATRALEEAGHAVLIDPMHGPVNAYRTKRYANHKQRTMALAENPTCAWPGCNKAGEECQYHHIKAWEHGGETNAANLVTLCAYHNGINDDDPNAPPRRGRIERINGQTTWIPPRHGG